MTRAKARAVTLPAEGTAALVRARLPTASVSDELVTLVHSRAQGNPFFTEELLKAFVENGALAAGDAPAGLRGSGEPEVPRSIRSVVGERIGRLTHESQELLRLASLLGQEFDLNSGTTTHQVAGRQPVPAVPALLAHD